MRLKQPNESGGGRRRRNPGETPVLQVRNFLHDASSNEMTWTHTDGRKTGTIPSGSTVMLNGMFPIRLEGCT